MTLLFLLIQEFRITNIFSLIWLLVLATDVALKFTGGYIFQYAVTIKNFYNMRAILSYLTILLISLTACIKDDDKPSGFLITGVSDQNVVIHDIDPDTLLTSFEVITSYDLDVSGDELNDLNLSVRNQYMYGGMVLWKSELKIQTLNTGTYIVADSVYPLVFDHGDTISLDDSWVNGELLLLKSSEGCCPPTGVSFHEGLWKEKKENYVGFRYDDCLGWLKIGVPGYTSIIIYEYAIQQ